MTNKLFRNKDKSSHLKATAWNAAGSIMYAFSTWLTGFIVSKHSGAGNYGDAGVFALALSFGNIFYVVSVYVLRSYYVSDTSERYTNSDYMGLRMITVAAGWLTCVLTGLIIGYEPYQLAAIAVYMLLFSSVAFSEYLFGVMQKNGHIECVGKSLVLRGVLTVALFAAMLYLTDNLLLSLAMPGLGSILICAAYDLRIAHRLAPMRLRDIRLFTSSSWRLFCETGSMLVHQVITILITFLPRILLERLSGGDEVAIFTYVFSPTVVITTFANSIIAPYMVPITQALSSGDRSKIKKIVSTLFTVISLTGVAGIIVSALLGRTVLTIVYDEIVGEYTLLLIISIVAVSLLSLASCCFNILIAGRRIKTLLAVDSIGCVLALVLCFILIPIPSVGIYGAAYAIVLAAGFEAVASYLYIRRMCSEPSLSSRAADTETETK